MGKFAESQAIEAALDESRLASEAGGSRTDQNDGAGTQRLGKVTAASGGVYTVQLIDRTGGVADTLEGLTAWGGNPGVGDKVALLWTDDRDTPVVMTSGGGGSTSVVAVASFTEFS